MIRTNRFRLLAVVMAVVFTATCTSTKEIGHAEMRKEFAEGYGEIVSFTTVDGVKRPFEGGATVVGDELRLRRRGATDHSISEDPNSPAEELHLPLREVSLVEIRYTDGLKTFGLTLLIIVVVLGAIVGIVAATKSSCPFIYSDDGSQYVFDGEPYGGAVLRSLARTDWSELTHLREVGGKYRLLLTNEVDETQHTDSLSLLVVDHPKDDRVVMGYDGRVHLLRRVESPQSARDETGRDLLGFLRAVDGVSWTPELVSVTDHLPVADVRNHLTLEFRRPQGARSAWLVANVATGPWGGAQLRTMLGMRGTGVQDWIREVDASPPLQAELRAWNDREELFHLGVEVQVGERWERRAMLLAGGPLHSETRAVALDLTGVEGDTVRLRVHPPISFWRFESFQMAWEERTGEARTVRPRLAEDEHGRNVRPLLLEDDGTILDQPDIGAVTRLEFDAPAAQPGMERTVFARTRGWYEVHLHGLGEPETDNLARLAYEPGYAVRRALADFAEFRRSGRVPFTAAPLKVSR